MLSPVYVFMKLNQKYVAVKEPLDFFKPEELEKLRPLGIFYLPEFAETALPYREAARQVHALLSWKPKLHQALPPAPYEISDSVLRVMGPLWGTRGETGTGEDLEIEPFFVAVFANELCDLLPGESLQAARDASIDNYELAIFRSSWAVWLALTLGWCDLAFLSALRKRVFDAVAMGQALTGAPTDPAVEVDELIACAEKSIKEAKTRALFASDFEQAPTRAAQKLAFRLRRIRKEFSQPIENLPTIYGERGFADG